MPDIERLERKNNHNAKGRTDAFASIRPKLCAGLDSNQRRPRPSDLQSDVLDHSTTDAYESEYTRFCSIFQQNKNMLKYYLCHSYIVIQSSGLT